EQPGDLRHGDPGGTEPERNGGRQLLRRGGWSREAPERRRDRVGKAGPGAPGELGQDDGWRGGRRSKHRAGGRERRPRHGTGRQGRGPGRGTRSLTPNRACRRSEEPRPNGRGSRFYRRLAAVPLSWYNDQEPVDRPGADPHAGPRNGAWNKARRSVEYEGKETDEICHARGGGSGGPGWGLGGLRLRSRIPGAAGPGAGRAERGRPG